MQFAIDLGSTESRRALLIDAPIEGIFLNIATGQRIASWFPIEEDFAGSIKGVVVVDAATINIVPAPNRRLNSGLHPRNT